MGTEAAILTIFLMTSAGTPEAAADTARAERAAVATTPGLATAPATAVRSAQSGERNVFLYSGRYYAFRGGAWFSAASDRGPWARIRDSRVPPGVRAALATHSRTPAPSASPRTTRGGSW